MIVATHWHDDHIRGLGKLVETCEDADFACAAALSRSEFLAYATANSNRLLAKLSRSTREITHILEILRSRKVAPRLIGPDRVVYSDSAFPETTVFSLSPSDEQIQNSFRMMADSLPQKGSPARRVSRVNPNDLSIVLAIKSQIADILLGGDLEEGGAMAWSELISNTEVQLRRSSFFKIPHHGSITGHCDKVWSDLLEDDPVVALTPWHKGRGMLPSETDVERILALSSRAFTTADKNSLAAYKRPNEVEKQLREEKITIRLAEPRPGNLCFRRKAGDAEWSVKMYGNARKLKQAVKN